MNAYLLDTNVLSELRKAEKCDENVKKWQNNIRNKKSYVSVMSMLEIKNGILLAQKRNPEFGKLLEDWYQEKLLRHFKNRLLPISYEVAEKAAQLSAERTRQLTDALLAATARVHELILVTRNVRDFEDVGIQVVNPWG